MGACLVGVKVGYVAGAKASVVESFSRARTAIPTPATANTAESLWLVRVNENVIYIYYV